MALHTPKWCILCLVDVYSRLSWSFLAADPYRGGVVGKVRAGVPCRTWRHPGAKLSCWLPISFSCSRFGLALLPGFPTELVQCPSIPRKDKVVVSVDTDDEAGRVRVSYNETPKLNSKLVQLLRHGAFLDSYSTNKRPHTLDGQSLTNHAARHGPATSSHARPCTSLTEKCIALRKC